jgi:Hemopexin
MSSSARIDAAFPAPGAASTSTVTSGGWAVDYDWVNDRVMTAGVPRRLTFAAPFDRDLTGVLPGQASFTASRYVFGSGSYLRLRAADGVPDAAPAPIAPAWGLPAAWTVVDAVFGGGGVKSGFAYFFRGPDYVRFDWSADQPSPGYPKPFGPNWHTTPDFAAGIDGSITGQAGFATKAYLFRTAAVTVNDDGALTPGGKAVRTTVYARYDYNTEKFEFTVTDPVQVVALWPGLLPMLDVGPAVDLAVRWIDQTLGTLAAGSPTLATMAAFGHHFGTGGGLVDPPVIATVSANFQRIRARLLALPDRLQWTPGLGFAAQTRQGILMEIGDKFSLVHGPNGRAAVMIHETVHFTFGAGPDVPEWSGATIQGATFGVATDPGTGVSLGPYSALSTAAALTNPSSYAAFAQEIALGSDERFGDARRHE